MVNFDEDAWFGWN